MNRRRMLATVGAAALIVLPGCGDSDDGTNADQEQALRELLVQEFEATEDMEQVCLGFGVLGDSLDEMVRQQIQQAADNPENDDATDAATRAILDDIGVDRFAEITMDVVNDECEGS